MDDKQTDFPEDNGHRARVEKDGTVKGSGVGAGGGQDGEDFDDDAASGSGYEPAEGFGTKD